MTDIIDPTKTFRLLEERIAKTTNPRHLLMLKRLRTTPWARPSWISIS